MKQSPFPHLSPLSIRSTSPCSERPCLGRDDYQVHRQSEKELKAQEENYAHADYWPYLDQEEISATTDLNREFNNYLDSFRSVVVYAAEIYGFYHEIDRMVNNLGSFNQTAESSSRQCHGRCAFRTT
jgi:hypothetical protein